MDLGIEGLDDDQLLALLEQACFELGMRTHGVRQLGLKTVVTQGEKTDAIRKSLEAAAESLHQAEIRRIKDDVRQEVSALYAAGKLRVMTPDVEATIVVTANQEALKQLDQLEKEMASRIPKGERFYLEISEGKIKCSVGPANVGRTINIQKALDPAGVQELGKAIRTAVGIGF
jgi:hypothetical protein